MKLFLKYYVPMVTEKFCIGFGKFVRQTNRLSSKRNEILFQGWLREKFLQAFAQDYVQTFTKSNQAGIKRGIVKRRKTKSVARVQTLVRKFAPRFDVARDQQARNIDAADAAPDIVGVENSLPEKLLAAPDFNCRLSFRRARRRDKTRLVALEKIHLLSFVLREQIVEHLFALRSKRRKIALKFIPHNPVLIGCANKPLDSACALNRIKRRKIAKFHRQTVCVPAHFLRNFDNDWISAVELAKRQFAVKIQRDECMFTRPFHSRSFCHARRLPGLGFRAPQTIYGRR